MENSSHRTGFSMRSLSEAVAMLGVLAGLLFVGLEIRNSTAVARAESRREVAHENIDFLMRVAEDPSLTRLWNQEWTMEFFEQQESADQTRMYLLSVALVLRFESVYVQFEESLLDESTFRAYGFDQPVVQTEFFRMYWEFLREIVDPDFVAYFEDMNEF